jgi:hypothetical protein
MSGDTINRPKAAKHAGDTDSRPKAVKLSGDTIKRHKATKHTGDTDNRPKAVKLSGDTINRPKAMKLSGDTDNLRNDAKYAVRPNGNPVGLFFHRVGSEKLTEARLRYRNGRRADTAADPPSTLDRPGCRWRTGVVPRPNDFNNLQCQTTLTALTGAKGIFLECQTGIVTPSM